MGQFDRKAQSEPKHGKPSSSGAYKGPPVMARGMPIHRKGPSYTPKKKAKQPAPSASATPEPHMLEHDLPLELEKRTLEVFRTTFPASNDFDALKPTLQEIKDALNCRDFETAFGKEEYLEAYAIRWGPSRTLGYAQLLAWVLTQRTEDECVRQITNSTDHQIATKVVCFGGAAAELMAFSGLLRHLRPSEVAGKTDQQEAQISEGLDASSSSIGTAQSPLLHLTLLDAALWNPQYSLFRLYSLYIQNSGFMFRNIIQNLWAFLRSKSIIDVYNRLSNCKYLAPMVVCFFGWFIAAFEHMAEIF